VNQPPNSAGASRFVQADVASRRPDIAAIR